jgi:hypothetical protein
VPDISACAVNRIQADFSPKSTATFLQHGKPQATDGKVHESHSPDTWTSIQKPRSEQGAVS